MSRPYRAQAVRKSASLWAVAARRIDVAQFAAQGDELELTAHEGERTLLVDGQRAFGSVPELEALGEQQGRSYAARAQRIDGDSWEVLVDAL